MFLKLRLAVILIYPNEEMRWFIFAGFIIIIGAGTSDAPIVLNITSVK